MFCIKIDRFGTYNKKYIRSHDVLNGLNSIKFLEIFHCNKTPNIFSTYQLKILTFKFRARAILNLFYNTHTPGFETFKFQNIFIYSTP